ncbi:N-acetyl-alpha-D-glucosaminyl L-malate synthase BshA [Paenibacillus athensensis]|uniref:N-acetyl-alpha-D-glucosaminyl L-malate synthase BshA n=1 Tax=Paenibacillus athensensis TaxID=1967502 RepID=A0A4Y8Q635_9BACL|nr:N-acetyl-alpha-D-glucosaminyl L-malate synthase BshA [Paenibacillus athensensis]MCD1259844.1 N-acetyl-alpha-D-glucosaminyl L-malate synthase BshA [Paenibacillus athensensis]
MLKIGIACYPTLGGSGVVATELGKLMAEQGHEVHFITDRMPFRLGQFHTNIFYHEVEVSDYYVFRYPPYDLALANKLAQVAKQQQLDILHVHYAVPHAICAYLAKQMVGPQLKVVTTLHGTDITILGQDPSLRDLIRLAIHQSDAVTAVSQDLIDETYATLQVEKPIELVYNFVDGRDYIAPANPALRQQYAPADERILLHMSNFRPVKRVPDVVDIFARVNEQMPSRLLFVGEGPDLAKAVAQVKQLGLADRVHYLGKQNNVAEVIGLADLLLLPSEKESFGLVALEAMAGGVPTVGSDSGGIPEVIRHGVDGFLAPVGDTERMAAYAVQLLQNRELYDAFSLSGLQRARSHFSAAVIAGQYERIYARVASGDRSDCSAAALPSV